eukprot:11920083-Ditylum_brightwellii.AAC.1
MTSSPCLPVGMATQNFKWQQIVVHRNKINSTSLKDIFYKSKKQLDFYFVFNNVVEMTVSPEIDKKKPDYKKIRPMLGWLPLEHHKSRTLQLNVPRLAETFATDTMFSSEPGLGGISCSQLFVGLISKLTKIFDMMTESEGPAASEDFICENRAPYALRSDNAKMQIGI